MADEGSAGPTRRAVLLGLSGGTAAGLLGTRALPQPAVTPESSDPAFGSVDTAADPVAETDTPYAVYQYRPTLVAGGFEPTLPINLVCPLAEADAAAVIETLQSVGWTDSITEQPRFAYDRAAGRYRPTTWTGGDDLYGIAGRLHVRCWHVAGRISLQAHVDTAPQPAHRIRSFAVARDVVETSFREAGWTVASRDRSFGNDQAPDHDGDVSVISR